MLTANINRDEREETNIPRKIFLTAPCDIIGPKHYHVNVSQVPQT